MRSLKKSYIKNKYENIINNINKLIKYINSLYNTCIIVEGQNDKKALELLNVSIPIYIYNSHIITHIYNNKYNRIIILTDWDKKGNLIYINLKRKLESLGLCVDEEVRRIFRTSTRDLGVTVEEICKKIYRIRLILGEGFNIGDMYG